MAAVVFIAAPCCWSVTAGQAEAAGAGSGGGEGQWRDADGPGQPQPGPDGHTARRAAAGAVLQAGPGAGQGWHGETRTHVTSISSFQSFEAALCRFCRQHPPPVVAPLQLHHCMGPCFTT